MKKTILSLGVATLFFAACQDAPKADQAEATEAQEVTASTGTTYNADLTQSKLEWIGTKPVGKHHGTIAIKSGSLTVADNNVTGGKFVFDIATITPDDQDAEGNAKLGKHLKSADFFDVEKFPEGTFEVTGVTGGIDSTNKDLVMKDATHTVTGNLTLKGTSKSITFPAKISITDASVTADANFNIDRTQWGIVYGNDKSLGDNMISPTVNLTLHLVANK